MEATQPVGSFKPNALGFYDLGGNVWEWMEDEMDEKTGRRVMRGGCWYNSAGFCRVSYRFSGRPDESDYSNGLRLVRRSGP